MACIRVEVPKQRKRRIVAVDVRYIAYQQVKQMRCLRGIKPDGIVQAEKSGGVDPIAVVEMMVVELSIATIRRWVSDQRSPALFVLEDPVSASSSLYDRPGINLRFELLLQGVQRRFIPAHSGDCEQLGQSVEAFAGAVHVLKEMTPTPLLLVESTRVPPRSRD